MSRRIQNKESLLDISGDSTTKNKSTAIKFKHPETTTVETKTGVLFPIKHLEKQLKAIKNGTKEISSVVFDGSSYGEPVTIKIKIDSKVTKCQFIDNDNKTHEMNTHILTQSVYSPDSDTPNFVIKQHLSDGGVMCKYEIKFPTYAISGQLAKITYMPKHCS